jgi:hypothetical protein
MTVNVANVAVVVNVKRSVKKRKRRKKRNNIHEVIKMVKYPFQFEILDNEPDKGRQSKFDNRPFLFKKLTHHNNFVSYKIVFRKIFPGYLSMYITNI